MDIKFNMVMYNYSKNKQNKRSGVSYANQANIKS
jgi:hypothetical protein